jgi:hypothetical protein
MISANLNATAIMVAERAAMAVLHQTIQAAAC